MPLEARHQHYFQPFTFCSKGCAAVLLVVAIAITVTGLSIVLTANDEYSDGPNRTGLTVLIFGIILLLCPAVIACRTSECCQCQQSEENENLRYTTVASTQASIRYPQQILTNYPPSSYSYHHTVEETLRPSQNRTPQTFIPPQLRPPEDFLSHERSISGTYGWQERIPTNIHPLPPLHNRPGPSAPQEDDSDLPPSYESLQTAQHKKPTNAGLADSGKKQRKY